jgi:fido (protein-threonine AMPylation protein)
MVFPLIKTIKGKKYNYLVHTLKENGQTKKITKYVGSGHLSKEKIKNLIEEHKLFFENQIELLKQQIEIRKYKSEFLTEKQVKWIQELRDNYVLYFEPFSQIEQSGYDDYFKVKYIYNSTNIEGNTLTMSETGLIVKDGITPSGKSLKEVKEVINLKKCIEYRKNYSGDVTEDFIKKLNEIILNNLNEEGGEYKKRPNYISGTDFKPSPPVITPLEMRGLMNWYNEEKSKRHILELACIFHQKFVMIHPFPDGNGRVVRELFNFILSRKKFPEIIFPVKLRKEYFDTLEKGDEGDFKPLIEFSLKILKEQYKDIFSEARGLDNWMP